MKGKTNRGVKFYSDNPAPDPTLEEHEQHSSPPEPHQLNFHTPEFNTTDDLDDNTGNYRSFSSLEGIVTADMRYHEERKKKEHHQKNIEEPVEPPKKQFRCEGIGPNEQPLPLTLTSQGRTLIISPDADTASDCGRILTEKDLSCTICVATPDGNALSSSRNGGSPLIAADTFTVSGSFCGFTVTALKNGDKTSLSTLTGKKKDLFDLVLDLQETPSYSGDQLPVGYYAPGEDAVLLDVALTELPEMRGQFTRPQFTIFSKDRCIHGRSSSKDCRLCLDICPVEAIGLDNGLITVDSYLCQGCAGCGLVCPADAIWMTSQEKQLADLGEILSESGARTGNSPALVLFDRNIDIDNFRCDDGSCIFFGVDEIASIGLHVLLVSLAHGAGKITIVCDNKRPEGIKQALRQQVELGNEIVGAIGLPEECFSFLAYPEDLAGELDTASGNILFQTDIPIKSPVTFSLDHGKRTLTRLVVQHLCKAAGTEPDVITLPENAPFGAIHIDDSSCTLCMACISACPSGSLVSNGNLPRISMVESKCHQCGFCEAACPEQAIRLQPRLLSDLEAADSPRILHEVEPFKCVECGEPFASRAMVIRMQDKLRTHWMYGKERQLRRLEMCRTCRTRDALLSGDYRS